MSSDDGLSKEQPVPEPEGVVYRPDVDTSSIDEARLMRKIDIRLIPWLALLYLLNFLDRGSIGNARVGLREKLSALFLVD